MALNVTTAVFGENCNTATASPSLAQWDKGQVLQISGVDLPDAYQVEFSTVYTRNAIPVIGNASGVQVPNELLQRSAPITACVVLHSTANSRETEYWVTIHITPRKPPETITPDPEQQDVIDQAIAALQDGTARAEAAATAAAGSATAADGSAENAEAWAVGQRAGEDVPDTDPTYHNNSKYYAGRAEAAAAEAGQHEASWESWVRRAESAADDAEGSARDAAGSKADATAAAQTATQKATEAGNSAGAAAGSASEARQTVDGAIGAINTAREGALNAIGSAGSNAVGAVEQAGTTQTGRVTTEGNTQVNRVQTKGDEVIGSIPPDYSDLADDVADLSRQLNDETTGLDTKAPVILETASGAIASFDDGADSMPIRKIVATIEPVQAAGTPSPENPLPISGWTGANVKQTADNAPSFYTFTGTTNQSQSAAVTQLSPNSLSVSATNVGSSYPATKQLLSEYSNLVLGRRYRVSAHAKVTSGTALISVRNSSNQNLIESKHLTTDGDVEVVFTLTSAMNYLSFFAGYNQKTGYVVYSDIKFQEVVTLSVNWQTEAGTVYGGTVTLNEDGSADVTVSWVGSKMLDLDWSYNSTRRCFESDWISNPVLTGGVTSVCCSMYKAVENSSYPTIDLTVNFNSTTTWYRSYFRIMDLSCNGDVSAFVSKITEKDGFITWMLRSDARKKYHFDNVGKLKTFLGVNNVWCDTGDITELVYHADTKLFLTARDEEITGNIAPIENGTTASKAYAAGDYFFHDTKFCKALTAIASGATFTLGTNYQETTVAAELLAAQN